MSIWDKILALGGSKDTKKEKVDYDATNFVIIDTEISIKEKKILDIGAIKSDGAVYHNASKNGRIKAML